VAVLVAVCTVMMAAFAMLVVDIGLMYSAKGDLQRAADSAALAGVSAFATDENLLSEQDQNSLALLARNRSEAFSVVNETLRAGTVLDSSDVSVGRHDFDNPNQPLASDGQWNAVDVVTRRTTGSSNGSVALTFARVFGNDKAEVTATARAVFMDNMSGYRVRDVSNLLPFTVQEDLFEDMVENGTDNYGYDGSVDSHSDDIHEVRLFPWKWKDADEALEAMLEEGVDGDGSGNFGILNVGVNNQGTSTLNDQIENGISGEHMENEFGTNELVFFNEDDGPITHTSTGTPGGHTAVKQALEERVGQVVGFFVHQGLPVGNGSNASYEISGIRYGRVMAVNLTGNPDDRALVIQPVAYTGDEVVVDEDAPSTDGLVGRIMLVK
jgi:hypothetical protein